MKEDLKKICRGAVEVISEEELVEKLKKKKKLRIKAGFDPTAPDLHLGHVVLLQKLKDFQDLGHQVIFLIGDYTATIGDPSGRNETRPQLAKDQIQENIATYKKQVFKILDPEKTEIVFNSTWMDSQSAADLIQLASRYNVARMLERDDFHKRHQEGHSIAIHEFLYPVIQGYDSVELKADVELGGTDQKFNLLVGRHMQREFKQEPQVILTMPLLVGTDGVQKMSKSYGNAIGIQEPPNEIFGKLMSISDELMRDYYELLIGRALDESLHPKEAKKQLALEVTARFHGDKKAKEAEQEFEKIFASKELPKDIEEVKLPQSADPSPLTKILADQGLAKSNSEARRLIEQGGVRLNEQRVEDPQHQIVQQGEYLIQVGKRRFRRIAFVD